MQATAPASVPAMTCEQATTEPRVGGYVTYRKAGQQKRRALIEWVNPDGTMRVRPAVGRRTTVTPRDVERARPRTKDPTAP